MREELQLLSYTPVSSNTVQKSSLPVDVLDIPVFMGFYTSQVVQDLFHQQYLKTHPWDPLLNKLSGFSPLVH